jgi:hypothetical protein
MIFRRYKDAMVISGRHKSVTAILGRYKRETMIVIRYQRKWLPLLLLMLASCHSDPPSRRVTVWRQSKAPYGTYVAYNGLAHLFPDAEVTINRKSPTELMHAVAKKAYIVITPRMDPDGAEVNAILNFAGAGNHVFISSFSFSDTLLHALNIMPAYSHNHFYPGDSLRLSVYNPVSFDSLSFAYPGYAYDDWARSIDSQYTTILGRDAKGRPDFVKFNYKGGGTVYLHFAPLAFSNFFLLHKNNKAYYDNVFSYIPSSVKEVIWDDYFRYDRSKDGDFSAFRYIFSSQPLRWAFWLLLLLFGLIYFFESKRKQRMVPVLSGLRNNSLDFVKTIGRLYYQRRDNHDLATKMAAHFQDHIRTRYNIPVTIPDPAFVDRLAFRTGIAREKLQGLVEDIQQLPERQELTDEELMAFHRQLEEFYKQG